jgi:hypothetical protein
LAYKFIRLYQFHYPIRLGLFEYGWKDHPELTIETAEDLMPGKRPTLDYVVDAILGGHAIVDENRWPPAS